MKVTELIHQSCVAGRRVRVLAKRIADLLPANATVLDVGCGDGILARVIRDQRPDLTMAGLDVLVRGQTAIPVVEFDGNHVPAEDRSFDVVMLVDVLHHTRDPLVLLREAARVGRRHILLKDHTRNGLLAGPTLRFMDTVGNARHGVALPYNYWTQTQWQDALGRLGVDIEVWQSSLDLYPAYVDWIFGRSLHFIALTGVPAAL